MQLIGENGLPRWHRWELVEGTLVESETKDGTVTLQVHGLSFLVMLPDPRRDRYRVTAILQHLQASPVDAHTGEFVGFDSMVGSNGTILDPVILGDYSESLSLGEIAQDKALDTGSIWSRRP